jgi:predicted alpha/beta-hydrolase family hydrolase
MTLEIDVQGQPVTASVHGEGGTALVLSHGAGGTRTMPWLVTFADLMAARGRRVLLHNFPYSEAGRRRIDPPARLEETVAAMVAAARKDGARRVVAGGRSMGGRMATRAAAAGLEVDALLLLAYPLHPPGEFDKLRDAHLPHVAAPPMFFVQGTRDEFARPDLLQAVLDRLGDRATLHRVDGGDHAFSMPRGTRRPVREVQVEIADAADGWLRARGL